MPLPLRMNEPMETSLQSLAPKTRCSALRCCLDACMYAREKRHTSLQSLACETGQTTRLKMPVRHLLMKVRVCMCEVLLSPSSPPMISHTPSHTSDTATELRSDMAVVSPRLVHDANKVSFGHLHCKGCSFAFGDPVVI
jgi:hypothetical protein